MNDFKQLIKGTRTHLMTGVSYMIPIVVAGGVLLAISVLLSGKAAVPKTGIWAPIAAIGSTGLGLMVPVLSAYIAYSMADRGGIAPGLIGGMISVNIGAGFIGGLISGWLAGLIVFYLKKIKVPKSLKSVMPIMVIPLISTLIVGWIMIVVLGQPISSLMKWLTSWLNSMSGSNMIILGLILGAMIAFDMGGPLNKVAFSFGVAMVGTLGANGQPSQAALAMMAGIGVAIGIPPIAMGVATLIAPKKFEKDEREEGKVAIILGLVGITEGAIPFAADDPVRVIPANCIGSAIGAAIAMGLGAGNPAPWGGWIVIFTATKPWAYILGSVVGIAITAVLTILLKKNIKVEEKKPKEEDTADLDNLDLSVMK
jgi:fructose-specific PTS system IIC-like component